MMTKNLIFCLILQAFVANLLVAQTDNSSNAIILAGGDTLFSPQIIKSKLQTNQDQLVYLNEQKEKQKLNAAQVKAYYFNNESFYSEKLKDDNIYRLISYEVGGYVSFGISYTANGDMNFYIKRSEEVIALEKYKYDLYSFFYNYLENFDPFYAQNKVKISYDFKTLAELISSYNAYKFPEKYVSVRYRNKELVSVGMLCSAGAVLTNLSGYMKENMFGSSFSLGLELESKYSKNVSIHLPLFYNLINSKASSTTQHMSAIHFEPYLAFETVPEKNNSVEFGFGLGLLYALKSQLDFSTPSGFNEETVELNKLNVGPNIRITTALADKLKMQFLFVHYFARSSAINQISLDDSSVKVGINNLRLIFVYKF